MYAVKVRKNKESIVESFYTCNLNGPAIVTTLAGPRLYAIAKLAHENLDAIEINSYEIDEKTFNSQVEDLQQLPLEIADKVNLYLNNISRAIVSNFMDIDLMGTVLTQGDTIRTLLEQQSYLEGLKCFIGTFSLRNSGGIDSTARYIDSIISLILKSNVSHTKDLIAKNTQGGFSYLQEYKTIFNKRVKDYRFITYSDQEGPMVTFRIIYE